MARRALKRMASEALQSSHRNALRTIPSPHIPSPVLTPEFGITPDSEAHSWRNER